MRKFAPVIFIGLLFLIADHYSYFEIIHKRPQSLHHWRQTDAASIALNYYNKGMDFFHPEVLFQIGDGETTGYTVSEFPGLYYLVAILWKIVGYNDIVFRQVTTLFFFLGLFAFYLLLRRLLKDEFWAMGIPLIFFASPSIVYYANNFTTDVPAFSLALMGLNSFFKHLGNGKKRSFVFAFIFFMFAGLLKVVALMAPIAICGIFLLATTRLIKKEWILKFRLDLFKGITIVSSFAVVTAWYLYAVHYNDLHRNTFFSTTVFPIWEMTDEGIGMVWKKVRDLWQYEYFNVSILLFLLAAFLWNWVKLKQQDRFLLWMNVFLFIGVILFVLMWFLCFENHDYYIISVMMLPVFTLIMLFDHMKREQSAVFSSGLLRLLFLILLLFNFSYAEKRLDDRYTSWMNEYPVYKDAHFVTPYLREIGIRETDKVISLPDAAPNYTLYLMNQPGWTQAFEFNLDSADIQRHIQLGAKYLIITEEEPLSRPYLKSYLRNKIGQYGTVSIFKL